MQRFRRPRANFILERPQCGSAALQLADFLAVRRSEVFAVEVQLSGCRLMSAALLWESFLTRSHEWTDGARRLLRTHAGPGRGRRPGGVQQGEGSERRRAEQKAEANPQLQSPIAANGYVLFRGL